MCNLYYVLISAKNSKFHAPSFLSRQENFIYLSERKSYRYLLCLFDILVEKCNDFQLVLYYDLIVAT